MKLEHFDKIKPEDYLLTEAPLPDEWDKAIYSERIPFTQRVEYAKQRAEQIGVGTSRVAFVIPYNGRRTVLKIAKNIKGMMQNEAEAELMSDWYIKKIGNVIPMIDYDERNNRPTWIHTEYAAPITQAQLERHFEGERMHNIISHLEDKRMYRTPRGNLPQKLFDNENYRMLEDLVGNFDLPAGDFNRKANWGLYKGTPVIIDLGYTNETAKYYK